MNDIANFSQLGEFLLNGISFEMSVQLDDKPLATTGFFSNCNAGGVTLYIRAPKGQMNFQIGNNTQTGTHHTATYSFTKSVDGNQGVTIDNAKVVHVMGVYDKATSKLNLYYNGVLIASADYGNRSGFFIGSVNYNKLGIGINASYPLEKLGTETGYTVLRARVYDVALSAQQVVAEYWDCIDTLTGK